MKNAGKELEVLLSEAGYDKSLCIDDVLSEGGLFVAGREFILISGSYKSQQKAVKQALKRLGINIPVYFLQPSQPTTHIDCEYGISDSARVLYIQPGISFYNRIKLAKIANRHNFELREYRDD